jgi:hypothetical protein
MRLSLDLDREEDARWIAEVPELPGVLVYGETREDAMVKVNALSVRVLADRIETWRIAVGGHLTFLDSGCAEGPLGVAR